MCCRRARYVLLIKGERQSRSPGSENGVRFFPAWCEFEPPAIITTREA